MQFARDLEIAASEDVDSLTDLRCLVGPDPKQCLLYGTLQAVTAPFNYTVLACSIAMSLSRDQVGGAKFETAHMAGFILLRDVHVSVAFCHKELTLDTESIWICRTGKLNADLLAEERPATMKSCFISEIVRPAHSNQPYSLTLTARMVQPCLPSQAITGASSRGRNGLCFACNCIVLHFLCVELYRLGAT